MECCVELSGGTLGGTKTRQRAWVVKQLEQTKRAASIGGFINCAYNKQVVAGKALEYKISMSEQSIRQQSAVSNFRCPTLQNENSGNNQSLQIQQPAKLNHQGNGKHLPTPQTRRPSLARPFPFHIHNTQHPNYARADS